MDTTKTLMQSEAAFHKRRALLVHLSRHALKEGVAYRKDIERYMQDNKDYQASLLYPVAARPEGLAWQKAVLQSLTEVRSVQSLFDTYQQTLLEVEKSIVAHACAVAQEWAGLQQYVSHLSSLQRASLYTSKTQHTQPLSVASQLPVVGGTVGIEEENVATCHLTRNGQYVLPQKEVIKHTLDRVYLEGVGSSVRGEGSIFEVAVGAHSSGVTPLTFTISLAKESVVNSILLGWMLPLPGSIKQIELLDRNGRLQRQIVARTLKPLLSHFGGGLELYFPPTNCATIRIACHPITLTRSVPGLVLPYTEEAVGDLQSFAQILENIWEASSVEDTHLQATLQGLQNSLYGGGSVGEGTRLVTLGLGLEARLVTFEASGHVLWGAYRGPHVRGCLLTATGRLPTTSGSDISYADVADTSNTPNGTVTWTILKRDYAQDGVLIRTTRAPTTPARPFHNRIVYLMQRMDGRREQNDLVYTLPHYVEPGSAVSLYIASADGYLPVSAHIERDTENLIVRVRTGGGSHRDIIARYDVQGATSGGRLSAVRPFYFQRSGGLRFIDPPEKVSSSDVSVLATVKRAHYSPYVTPVISGAALTCMRDEE